MIKRKLAAAVIAALWINICAGQNDTLREKKLNHYIGVQANQLIRQIINFDSDNEIIDNPYLLTYAMQTVKRNWGWHAGFGYNYQKFAAEEDESFETKVNDLFYRVGGGKRFRLGKRFEAGLGLDFAGDYRMNRTFNSEVTAGSSFIDSSFSKVNSRVITIGGGPQFNVAVYLTERVLFGTETTYYFLQSKEKQNIQVEQKVINLFNNETTINFSNFNEEANVSNFSIKVPVAIFLIVKL